MNVEKLNVQISADVNQFRKGIEDVKKSLSGLTTDTRQIMQQVNSYITRNFGNIRIKNIIDSKSVQNMMLPLTGLSGTIRTVTEQINEATGMIVVLQNQVKEFKGLGFSPDDITDLYEQLGKIQSVQEQLIEQREKLLANTEVEAPKIETHAQEQADEYKNAFTKAAQVVRDIMQANLDAIKSQMDLIFKQITSTTQFYQQQAINNIKQNYTDNLDGTFTHKTSGKTVTYDELVIKAAIEAANATQKLRKELEQLDNQYNSINKSVKNFSDKIKSQADVYKELQKQIKQGKANKIDVTPEGKEALDKAVEQVKNLRKQAASDVFGNIKENITSKVTKDLSGLKNTIQPLENIGVNVSSVTAIIGYIRTVAQIAKKVIAEIDNAIENTIQVALKGISLIGQGIAGFWTAIITGTKNFTSLIGQVIEKVDVLGNMFEKLQSFFSRLSKMISRVFVFTVFTKFFRTLRSEITAYLSANAQLQAELASLKGAWLTAFQPIYETILPIIQTLVHWITILGQKMAQLISIFTGKSVKSMAENAKALYDQAHATEAAGAAAEEAKKQLMGFDQLNILQDNSSSGGGASTDISTPDFSWGEDAEQFKNFGDWLFDFFNRLTNQLPSINDALSTFADTINNFFKELDSGFTRTDVIDKSIEFFTGLANALNNFVNKVDFSLIGKTIADGLNLILVDLNAFIDSFNWTKLGSQLASGANSMIANLNFEELGKFLVQKFNVIFETLAGFFTTFNWETFGNQLSVGINSMVSNINIEAFVTAFNAFVKGMLDAAKNLVDNFNINGFIEQLNKLGNIDVGGILTRLTNLINSISSKTLETLQRIDFGKIASTIAEGLSKSIQNLNTQQLGQVIGTLITSAIEFAGNFVSSFDWKGFSKRIAEFLNGAIKSINFKVLGKTLADGINSIFASITSFSTTFNWKSLGNDIAGGINTAINTIDVNTIANGINSLAHGVLDGIKVAIERLNWDELKSKIGELIGRIDFGSILKDYWKIKDTVRAQVWDGFIKAIQNVDWIGVVSALVQHLITAVLTIDKGIIDVGVTIIEFVLEGIVGVIAGIGSWVKDNIIDPFIQAFTGNKKEFNDIGEDISDGLEEGMGKKNWHDVVKELIFNTIKNAIILLFKIHSPSKVMEEYGEDIGNGLYNGLELSLSDIGDLVKQAFQDIKDGISQKWDEIKEKTSEIWENVKSNVSEKVENIKGNISDKVTNIKDTVSEKWNNLKTNTSDTWDKIKSAITTKIDESKNNTSTKTSDIKTDIINKWNDIKTQTSSIWNNIKTDLTAKVTKLQQDIVNKWKDIQSNTTTIWNNIRSTLANTWNSIKSDISTHINNIRTEVVNKWNEIKTNTTNTWNNIKSSLSTTWNSIKTDTTTKLSGIKSEITNRWNEIKTNTTSTWINIKNEISSIWTNIKNDTSNKVVELKNTLNTNWNNIKTTASNTWNAIKTTLTNTVSNIKTTVTNDFNTLKTNVSKTWDTLKSEASTKWSSIKSSITSVASSISSGVQSTFNTMKNNLSTVFTNIGTSLSNALSGAQSKLSSIASSAQSTVSKITSSVSSAASNTFNYLGSSTTSGKPYITSYSYVNGHKYANYSDGTRTQLYASGGVITRPTQAIVGEYANAATNPEIITPESKMRQVFKEVLGNQVNTPEMVNNILAAISRNTQAIIDKDTDVYIDKYKVNKVLNSTQKQQTLLYQNII